MTLVHYINCQTSFQKNCRYVFRDFIPNYVYFDLLRPCQFKKIFFERSFYLGSSIYERTRLDSDKRFFAFES